MGQNQSAETDPQFELCEDEMILKVAEARLRPPLFLTGSDTAPFTYSGLVLQCGWPPPESMRKAYEDLSSKLFDTLPEEAYIYPFECLHCTIATCRSFKMETLLGIEYETEVAVFKEILAEMEDMPEWPETCFRLRWRKPTLESKAAIFWIEDVDGAVGKIRDCFRKAIEDRGGKAAEGSDFSQAVAVEGLSSISHIPDIQHSTLLRWTEKPSKPAAEVVAAFNEIVATWETQEVIVPSVQLIQETTPYMHVPDDRDHVARRIYFQKA